MADSNEPKPDPRPQKPPPQPGIEIEKGEKRPKKDDGFITLSP